MECRKSVRDLTPTEKTAYVNAVLALKTAPSLIPAAQTMVTAGGGTPNRYDDYVWIHNQIGMGAHRGPAFGPWHREFLRQFELDLQMVSGDSHISIPYWDWTVDRAPTDLGWPFTNDFMGGFGSSSPQYEVTTGPFSNPATWRISIRRTGEFETRLKRSIGVPSGASLPTTPTARTGLAVTPYDVSPFHSMPQDLTAAERTAQANASFRKYLEWLLHDGVHGWVGGFAQPSPGVFVGGHMTFPPVAVNDPIFFLHHAAVDRLWTIWQQLHPTLDYEPASGANTGHNRTDTMLLFANQAHFNHPLANRPADQTNYHARNVWYVSDLPTITPVSLSVNFGNVPEGLTTQRPVQFQVRTCQRVIFRVSGVGGANYTVPSGQGDVAADHSEIHDPVTANVYLEYHAVAPLGTPQPGSATVRAYIVDRDGYFEPTANAEHPVGTWTINMTAAPVPRPRSAVVMVLDRSGSMSESAGAAGTKYDLLKSALQTAANILRDDDAIGLVSYDDVVATVAPMTQMGAMSPTGAGRTAVTNAIGSGAFSPRDLTAIGSGMIAGASVLNAERTNPSTPYANFAMLVMTDGNENVPPNAASSAVATAIAGFADRVYAVGLGREDNVSVATLGAIARYMLITGDITSAERRFRLTKYFVQILAAVSNTSIVIDPQGDLHLGVEHRIPFQISEADAEIEVIALSPAAYLLDFRLEAPDGTVISPSSASPNVSLVTSPEDAFYRIGLPAIPGRIETHAGTWQAVLSVGYRRQRVMTLLAETELVVAREVAAVGTLPYSLLVRSYSNIALAVEVTPTSGVAGTKLRFDARLTEYDVPIRGRARVAVEVLDPKGGLTTVALEEGATGGFVGGYDTSLPGLYTCRFVSAGTSIGGHEFQREETRSAAIGRFRPGDVGDGGAGAIGELLDDQRRRFCAMIRCLIDQDGALGELAERLGIDPQALVRCVDVYCGDRKLKLRKENDR